MKSDESGACPVCGSELLTEYRESHATFPGLKVYDCDLKVWPSGKRISECKNAHPIAITCGDALTKLREYITKRGRLSFNITEMLDIIDKGMKQGG